MNPTHPNFTNNAELCDAKQSLVSTSLGLLKMFGTKRKRLHGEKLNERSSIAQNEDFTCQTLPSLTLIKFAKARLLQLNSQKADLFSILSTNQCEGESNRLPFDKYLEISMLLHASAQLVVDKKYVSARKFLCRCHRSGASESRTPLQRVVYYFSEALQEKIDRELGIIALEDLKGRIKKPVDVQQTLLALLPSRMSCEQELSISVVTQFTGIQSILDSVASAKRVHLIDFRIKNGSHWTILMQALAGRHECPVELLKITAIGTSKEMMEETGKWLVAFAMTMHLPFSFDIVVSELKDIEEEMFDIKTDETLVIYSTVCLWTVLAWPNQLEALIKVVKSLSPCLVVINEMNASMNSPNFLERFTEMLSFYCPVIDCLEITIKDRQVKKFTEEVYFKEMIRNAITSEGIERYHRYENASFWRKLFARFEFVETELSPSALSQARLLFERSSFCSSLSLEMDGKCLIAGWKGSGLEFVSAWKLQ